MLFGAVASSPQLRHNLKIAASVRTELCHIRCIRSGYCCADPSRDIRVAWRREEDSCLISITV